MTIGNRIKQRRIELGLSVEELSEMLNKNRATIYRYENGDIENFPIATLEPLAIVLRTTPAELMGWEEEKTDLTKVYFYVSPGMPGEIMIGGYCYESKIKCIVTLDNIYICSTHEASNYIIKRIKEELFKKECIKQTGVYGFTGMPYYEIV